MACRSVRYCTHLPQRTRFWRRDLKFSGLRYFGSSDIWNLTASINLGINRNRRYTGKNCRMTQKTLAEDFKKMQWQCAFYTHSLCSCVYLEKMWSSKILILLFFRDLYNYKALNYKQHHITIRTCTGIVSPNGLSQLGCRNEDEIKAGFKCNGPIYLNTKKLSTLEKHIHWREQTKNWTKNRPN